MEVGLAVLPETWAICSNTAARSVSFNALPLPSTRLIGEDRRRTASTNRWFGARKRIYLGKMVEVICISFGY